MTLDGQPYDGSPAPEPEPEQAAIALPPSSAAGGKYAPIMRRRLKKFLAMVEDDDGWE